MKRKQVLYTALLVMVVAVAAFIAGRVTAPVGYDVTFYAEIEEIRDGSFLVEGLEVNDINNRGRVWFEIGPDTLLLWHHTEISAEELQVGDTISVTYAGPVQETDPGHIVNAVLKIILLDDEK